MALVVVEESGHPDNVFVRQLPELEPPPDVDPRAALCEGMRPLLEGTSLPSHVNQASTPVLKVLELLRLFMPEKDVCGADGKVNEASSVGTKLSEFKSDNLYPKTVTKGGGDDDEDDDDEEDDSNDDNHNPKTIRTIELKPVGASITERLEESLFSKKT